AAPSGRPPRRGGGGRGRGAGAAGPQMAARAQDAVRDASPPPRPPSASRSAAPSEPSLEEEWPLLLDSMSSSPSPARELLDPAGSPAAELEDPGAEPLRKRLRLTAPRGLGRGPPP
ncbi:unnamed protein product, partial [Prorocentrum cordatum]